jgi:hypothetical protein
LRMGILPASSRNVTVPLMLIAVGVSPAALFPLYHAVAVKRDRDGG